MQHCIQHGRHLHLDCFCFLLPIEHSEVVAILQEGCPSTGHNNAQKEVKVGEPLSRTPEGRPACKRTPDIAFTLGLLSLTYVTPCEGKRLNEALLQSTSRVPQTRLETMYFDVDARTVEQCQGALSAMLPELPDMSVCRGKHLSKQLLFKGRVLTQGHMALSGSPLADCRCNTCNFLIWQSNAMVSIICSVCSICVIPCRYLRAGCDQQQHQNGL